MLNTKQKVLYIPLARPRVSFESAFLSNSADFGLLTFRFFPPPLNSISPVPDAPLKHYCIMTE